MLEEYTDGYGLQRGTRCILACCKRGKACSKSDRGIKKMGVRRSRFAGVSSILAAGLIALGVVPAANAAPVPPVNDGDSVYIGQEYTSPVEPGSAITFPIYTLPVDLDNLGDPDFWAYCLEQQISARDEGEGTVGPIGSFEGTNYFATNTQSQAKVLWVLANGYPSLSLADLSADVGVTLTYDEAISAMTTAIWRFTEFPPNPGNDVNHYWVSANAEAAYRYLLAGAHESGGTTPASFETTVSVTPPAGAQTADSLVGPFTVSTNKPTASVSVDPVVPITDSTGALINASAVVDGQQIYLDLRGTAIAGSATVTAAALGSSATGKVITVPDEDGGHWQSMILVAPAGSETTATASAQWAAAGPAIGTTLTVENDGGKVLPWDGGDLIDTVAYEGLEVGSTYVLEGELFVKSTGLSSGITGSVEFVPTTASGTVQVPFSVSEGFAGEELVAFEELWNQSGAVPVIEAQHKDLEDAAQTVSVGDVPAIATTLVDKADNDQVLAWQGGTVVDTISYENLTPGTTYRVEGELMRKSDGSSTGITAEAEFTPVTANGTTTVEFTVPAGYHGVVLVAFERLFVGDSAGPLAVHEDINDAAQTVSVAPQPVAQQPTVTPSSGPSLAGTGVNPMLPVGLAALLAITGVLALVIQRRRAVTTDN